MPSFKSTSRRTFCLAVAGVAFALASAGIAHAQDVRTIKIATAAESKPLSWGAIGVEPQGYEPDVLKAINAKLPQYKFEMEGAADIAQETGLATGKYDIATGGYYRAPAREKQFLIPESPIGASLIKIYSRKDSGINEMKDLVGKKIVPVTAGGGIYKFATQWQEQNPDHQIEITASSAGIPYPDRLKEVQNGKYDALVLPSNLGEQTVIDNQKLDIKASEPVAINNTFVLIHRSEENKTLSEDIDKALKELKADGTLAKFSQKWFGEDITTYMK
ncbi:amino acid ABC transporter substrate-binding protein [Mesorhizobium sp.]|uniref:amino acid ABC transporter substrate-binding protein n=1 Tax=Mesorhizobium sp. TaxID=1871066 RepID=UPI000FE63E7F|nr:amino acid ABC transporter substrate-binding protein [Mesorhizobium sp.]RWO89051.1 MAG: amino acid ABC transporter substrate-binding protein [Mesorhizobium sp.]RWP26604.1 MAG: amino acid ABC transporter substrate-binding protein [Mesorhizobium sp.]RWQ51639.1 MAG: amino acid ABC transporter substrate-binding protein [Mesorhizobium sp.]TIL63332.1 MAG: amino acid ABC transporter substrate-binding protein [Mesorhizobium sp.]TIM05046.1 MAG: amino acid ABC transporter substrate-binding protein [M